MDDAHIWPLADELGIDRGFATNDVRGRPGLLDESLPSASTEAPLPRAAAAAASLISVGARVLLPELPVPPWGSRPLRPSPPAPRCWSPPAGGGEELRLPRPDFAGRRLRPRPLAEDDELLPFLRPRVSVEDGLRRLPRRSRDLRVFRFLSFGFFFLLSELEGGNTVSPERSRTRSCVVRGACGKFSELGPNKPPPVLLAGGGAPEGGSGTCPSPPTT